MSKDRTLFTLTSIEAVATAFGEARLINHHAEWENTPPREAMVTSDISDTSNNLDQHCFCVFDIGTDLLVPSLGRKGRGSTEVSDKYLNSSTLDPIS